MKRLLPGILLLALWGYWPALAQGSNLQVSFAGDTLYACAHEPFSLTPQVSGGSGALHYQWSTGDTTPVLWTVPDTGATLFVLTVSDQAAQSATDSVWVVGYPECVWPGDANGDGIANNQDVLMLGVAFGANGALRPNAHLNWIGQPAPAWGHTFAAGVNYVHADGDGNGWADAADLTAISHNYLTPQSQGGLSPLSAQGIPLYVDMPTGSYQPGDTVIAPIMLGTASLPADSVYGLAFSIHYQGMGLETGAVSVDYTGSWLGQAGQSMITLDQNFPQAGQIDVGMSRINQITQSGYGRLGDITVVIDDIAGKRGGIEMVNIIVDHITLVGAHGQPLPVNVYPAQLAILLNQESPLAYPGVEMYVAGQQALINDEAAGRFGPRQVELLDMQGRLISQIELGREPVSRLPLPDLPQGVYLLRLSDSVRQFHQKAIIR